MERNGIQFYKLDKSKRYAVEGTQFRIGQAILIGVVLSIFLALAIALFIVNFGELFRNAKITVFTLIFFAIVAVITACTVVRYLPVIKQRKRARNLLKKCTLTDGTVLEVHKQRMQHTGTNKTSNYTYYLVQLKYSFYGTDGELRYGEFQGNYGNIPFYVGQNLMIAFYNTDSLILNKFHLRDGAEEFARAEEERGKTDFSDLTGELIMIDVSKPISIEDYAWSKLYKIAVHQKRLEKILKDQPSFTTGKFFIKKSTYRYRAKNNLFYGYKDQNGIEHIEECEGIENLTDGEEVTVAYSNGISEIITDFTLKKKRNKKEKLTQ